MFFIAKCGCCSAAISQAGRGCLLSSSSLWVGGGSGGFTSSSIIEYENLQCGGFAPIINYM